MSTLEERNSFVCRGLTVHYSGWNECPHKILSSLPSLRTNMGGLIIWLGYYSGFHFRDRLSSVLRRPLSFFFCSYTFWYCTVPVFSNKLFYPVFFLFWPFSEKYNLVLFLGLLFKKTMSDTHFDSPTVVISNAEHFQIFSRHFTD